MSSPPAGPAVQHIITVAAIQQVIFTVPGQYIVMVASDNMLDAGQRITLSLAEFDRICVMQAHQDTHTGTRVIRMVSACPAIERVGAGAAIEFVIAAVAIEGIVTATAPKPVIAVTAAEVIRNGIAGNQIVPRPGNEIFNYRVTRNNKVTCQAIYIRDSFRAQVYSLVVCVRAQVQRVITAVVIKR